VAQITIDNQNAPANPSSGKSVVWVDSGSNGLIATTSAGKHLGSLSRNESSANQGPGFASDTYITNSGLLIPSFGMKVGQMAKWTIALSKTAAGVAAPVLQVRIGPNQSTADTSRLTFTSTIIAVATATAGLMIVMVGVNSVAASGAIAGGYGFTHTNFGDGGAGASIGFDNTAVQGQFLGLSFNAGASASYTISHVSAELIG